MMNEYNDRHINKHVSKADMRNTLGNILKAETEKIVVIERSQTQMPDLRNIAALCKIEMSNGDFPTFLEIDIFDEISFSKPFEFEEELSKALDCDVLIPYGGSIRNPYLWLLISGERKHEVFVEPELLDEKNELRIERYASDI